MTSPENLLHQRATGFLALMVDLAHHGHCEGITGGRNEPTDILADLADATGRHLDVTFRIAHLPAHRILDIVMGGAAESSALRLAWRTI
ncbi:hypothetical protein [Rhizobium sp. L9]|uniref:hypothetical protein n=1 Tax=Rhizobium sp. L9 TaxID=1340738 RepID=UPI00159658FD|nr:hypothetical protein [Rhizobium sp. L9]